MPSQAQIQTYATYTVATFPGLLQRFRAVLSRLGCQEQDVLDWIMSIALPESQDDDSFGDIYASPVTLIPPGTEGIVCDGIEVSLYTHPAIPSIDELPTWVGFNLLVDTTELQAIPTTLYKAAGGYTIWHILLELAHTFPELGAYFTNEWQENQVWRTIVENAGDPWVFDLGIFPRKLARFFETVPDGFQGTVTDDGFGFALASCWQKLPWAEIEKGK